jgi:hypothetical protein
MPVKNRLKISASVNWFTQEINRLRRFDFDNQKKFNNRELTISQLELLVESIFFNSFRSYEGFIREIFILYCMEKKSSKRPHSKSYLQPINFLHAEQLLKSSMDFLDWTSPDTVINRAELCLENGHPVKLPYTINRLHLQDFKKIRNHIAHNSIESEQNFSKVVRTYYNGVTPFVIPNPAKYLMLTSRVNPLNYILLDFFDLMIKMTNDLT